MFKVTMNTTSKRGAEEMLQAYGEQLVEFLANKYGFDAAEAKEALASVVVDKPKAANKTNKTKKPKADKPTVPLPFCGQVKHDWCQAIVSNNKLFSQCTSAKKEGCDYCSSCMTKAMKNNGVPPYGVIQDRLNGDYKDKDGNAPVKYGNVLKAKKIDPEEAKAEAAKFGLTIPEEEFEVIVKKKGRKSKGNAEGSSSEDETSNSSGDEANNKKAKKPRKEKTEEEKKAIQEKRKKTLAMKKAKKESENSSEDEASSGDEANNKKAKKPRKEKTEEEKKAIQEKRKKTLAMKKAKKAAADVSDGSE